MIARAQSGSFAAWLSTQHRSKSNVRRVHAERAAEELTAARRRVFDELLKGGSAEEVADDLGLSRATVRNHIIAILRHFEVSSRCELLALFVIPPRAAQS